jgi:hypothetical protein
MYNNAMKAYAMKKHAMKVHAMKKPCTACEIRD